MAGSLQGLAHHVVPGDILLNWLHRLRTFSFFFAVQFVSYALITWNYRSIAQGRISAVFASDLCFAAVNFTLIKRVAKAECPWAMAGYVLGGACGSVASVVVTKWAYGS